MQRFVELLVCRAAGGVYIPCMADPVTLPLKVLGIESSCDETAASVLVLGEQGPEVLSDVILGQADQHALFGGVVPEIAARAHAETLDHVIAAAMREAGAEFADPTQSPPQPVPASSAGLWSGWSRPRPSRWRTISR
jgi:hypothetical protein